MIMLHYYAGSNYETDFWEFAQKRGQHCIEESLIYNNDFNKIITHTLKKNDVYDCDNNLNYGNWPSSAYYKNIHGLGIKNKLLELLM